MSNNKIRLPTERDIEEPNTALRRLLPSAPPADGDADADDLGSQYFAVGSAEPLTPLGETFGPCTFYRLSPMSVAGLKSVLKMDATISLLLSVALILIFAIVGVGQTTLAPLTRAAIGVATAAAIVSFLNGVVSIVLFASYRRDKDNTYPPSPRLAFAKFGIMTAVVAAALATCILARSSPDAETGLGLLAFTSGIITIPIYVTFFVAEMYALLWRPRLLERRGMVPTLDEDVDVCCAGM